MGRLKQGDKFGRLTVINETSERLNRCIIYKCKCDCGNIVYTTSTRLKKGYIRSCGCLQKERASEANKTHGMSKTKLYYVWHDMRKRCNDKKHHAYKDYGGRGISVCEEWNSDYLSFYTWALNNGYMEGLSIDRINNDEGYNPDNCRWTTVKTQANNRRPKDITFSNNPNAKSVSKFTLGGEYIESYDTIKEACIKNNIQGTGTSISACCRGKQKTAYGFVWKYTND